jgi:hypothetical protein
MDNRKRKPNDGLQNTTEKTKLEQHEPDYLFGIFKLFWLTVNIIFACCSKSNRQNQ